MLVLLAYSMEFCMQEWGFTLDSLAKGVHTVVRKYVVRILKGETSTDKVPQLLSYAQRRFDEHNPYRWIKCGGYYIWEEVYLSFPKLAEGSDPAVIDSAEALFVRRITEHLREPGRYWGGGPIDSVRVADAIAWEVVAYASFLNYLRWRGVERFREEFTCGYW